MYDNPLIIRFELPLCLDLCIKMDQRLNKMFSILNYLKININCMFKIYSIF